jgi:Domain of unknown function (DUF4437)
MWNRKHIEFVRFGEIESKPLEIEGLPSGLSLKTLSIDESNGALSGILSVPKGWHFDKDFTSNAPEQLFVLSGDLQINGTKMTEQFYSYRPKGSSHGQMFSEKGCEAIVMWDEKFTVNVGDKGNTKNIIINDTIKTYWEPTIAQGPAAGIKVKRLREVAETGEMTFIVGIMPNWFEGRPEHHPCVEESFKIFGDMNLNTNLGDELLMGENSYFYRPPWIKHGPLYTKKGTMSLVRVSSTLVNRYMPLEEDVEYLALKNALALV